MIFYFIILFVVGFGKIIVGLNDLVFLKFINVYDIMIIILFGCILWVVVLFK